MTARVLNGFNQNIDAFGSPVLRQFSEKKKTTDDYYKNS